MGKRKRRLGDRYDGRRLRSIDPFMGFVPFIMKTRSGAQNYFDERINLAKADEYMKAKRNAGIRNVKLLHIIIAAAVRTFSQKPGMNRFIIGHRLYARNDISISFVVKKEMKESSEETTLKVIFDPTDTLDTVVEKVNNAIMQNKGEGKSNDTDKTAKIFMFFPRFLIKFAVWFILTLDYHGLMPKAIHRVSPFHASLFITDLGSLGIQPVYHHLYDLGTCSVFLAFGAKKKEKYFDDENNVAQGKYLEIKITGDERIIDGFYFSNAFKLFRRLLENPERLEAPPETVVEDVD